MSTPAGSSTPQPSTISTPCSTFSLAMSVTWLGLGLGLGLRKELGLGLGLGSGSGLVVARRARHDSLAATTSPPPTGAPLAPAGRALFSQRPAACRSAGHGLRAAVRHDVAQGIAFQPVGGDVPRPAYDGITALHHAIARPAYRNVTVRCRRLCQDVHFSYACIIFVHGPVEHVPLRAARRLDHTVVVGPGRRCARALGTGGGGGGKDGAGGAEGSGGGERGDGGGDGCVGCKGGEGGEAMTGGEGKGGEGVVNRGESGRVSDVQRGGAAEGAGGRPRDRRAACGAVPELLALSRRRSRRRFGRTATAAKRAARRCGKPLVARRREKRGHAVHEHERVIVLGDVLVAVRAHAALTSFRDELATAAIRSAIFMREPTLWPRAHARSQQRSRKVQCGAAQPHACPATGPQPGRRAQTPRSFPGNSARSHRDSAVASNRGREAA
eukprot:scaffold66136_cov64-Phaeocystis_antarctica.AAC.2